MVFKQIFFSKLITKSINHGSGSQLGKNPGSGYKFNLFGSTVLALTSSVVQPEPDFFAGAGADE